MAVIVLISDKINLKGEIVTRDKEGHYIKKKMVNPSRRYNNYKLYAPNIRAPKCMKQNMTELREERDNSKIIV